MNKYIVFFFICTFYNYVNSQLVIYSLETMEEPDGSAMLEIQTTDKGLLLPQLALTSLTDTSFISGTVPEGLMIYNVNENQGIELYAGYYFWSGSSWKGMGILQRDITVSDVFETNVLGYDPLGTGETSPAVLSVNGITATKDICAKWIPEEGGNNHSYCVYTLDTSADWAQSFNIAKALSGYLPTITSDREWDFIHLNNIKSNTSDLTSNNFWLGYNRRGFLNNDGSSDSAVKFRYSWITGEIDKTNWTTGSVESQFDNLDFENSDVSSKNCGYIYLNNNGGNSWGATDCTLSNANHLIVEFNS
ncbi:C-type lectin domain-containing protein [Apibacter sp. HY039]|uniref:C-type lectin domain-containing protein n=1 Tax=Apibacter sp. HY039 TaxID=2501476 RepID=UPI000FEB7871|nr:C-type lectin domain-containing protein [Apibacter sp. HY039]